MSVYISKDWDHIFLYEEKVKLASGQVVSSKGFLE